MELAPAQGQRRGRIRALPRSEKATSYRNISNSGYFDPKWRSAEKVAAQTERLAEFAGRVAGCTGQVVLAKRNMHEISINQKLS
jgi:hypothetical protein